MKKNPKNPQKQKKKQQQQQPTPPPPKKNPKKTQTIQLLTFLAPLSRLGVQGSATSPLFTPPLFQNMWPCVQLLCAECNAPCQRDLAIDKAKPPASAAK